MKASEYESSFEQRPGRTVLRVLLITMGIIIALSAIGWVFGIISLPFRAAGGVISRTLEPDNIISNYEWYYDTYNSFEARKGQIASHLSAMKAAKADGANITIVDRYRVELEGMRQSCRDMAARYNANSSKINRVIFRGRQAPVELISSECEAS